MSLLNLIITFIKTFSCKQSKKLPMFRLLQDTSESEISNYCQKLFHSLDRPFGPWPFVDSKLKEPATSWKLCNTSTIPELAPKISHCVMSFELLKKEVVNWSENFLFDWGCDYYGSKFFRSVRKFVMVSVVQVTDKRTDVWSRDIIIWKINSELWALVWAGLWNKKVWADYEQLLRPVFLKLLWTENLFKIFFENI